MIQKLKQMLREREKREMELKAIERAAYHEECRTQALAAGKRKAKERYQPTQPRVIVVKEPGRTTKEVVYKDGSKKKGKKKKQKSQDVFNHEVKFNSEGPDINNIDFGFDKVKLK